MSDQFPPEIDVFARPVPDDCLGFLAVPAAAVPALSVIGIAGFEAALADAETAVLAAWPDPRTSVETFVAWRLARFADLETAVGRRDGGMVETATALLMWAAVNFPGREASMRAHLAEAFARYGRIALVLAADPEGRVATLATDRFAGVRQLLSRYFAAVPKTRRPTTFAFAPPVARDGLN